MAGNTMIENIKKPIRPDTYINRETMYFMRLLGSSGSFPAEQATDEPLVRFALFLSRRRRDGARRGGDLGKDLSGYIRVSQTQAILNYEFF
jgi:hypothetical protein